MKSFFNKLTSTPAKGKVDDKQLASQLEKATSTLTQLSELRQANFPLLNEATRSVQLLGVAVMAQPDSEAKVIWREQLLELQRGLQAATESMLKLPPEPSPRQSADAEVQPPVMTEPAEGPLFAGLDLEALGASQGAEGADLFAGLNMSSLDPDPSLPTGFPESSSQPLPAAPVPQASVAKNLDKGLGTKEQPPRHSDVPEADASPAVSPSTASRPLPEDLFSGLEDLALTSQPSSSAAAPARALNPLEAPLETAVPGSSSYPPDDPYAPVDPFSMSIKGPPVEAPPAAKAKASDSGGSGAHAGLEAAAAPTQRKKKVTRRIGYDRDDAAAELAVGRPVPQPGVQYREPLRTEAAAGQNPAPAAAQQQEALTTSQSSTPIPGLSNPGEEAAQAPMELSSLALFDGLAGPSSEATAAPLDLSMQSVKPGGSSAAQVFEPEAVLAACEGQGLSAQVAALRKAASSAVQQGVTGAESARQGQAGIKARRRVAQGQLHDAQGRVKKLTRLEEEAVQAEDFEAAAGHSADLDAAQQLVQKLQQDLRQAEDQLAAMEEAQVTAASQQAEIWLLAASALDALQARSQQARASDQAATAQARQENEEARSTAAERLDELKARIESRDRLLQEEQAAVQHKVEEAQRPFVAKQNGCAQQCALITAKVASLRAELAEQEAALEAAQQEQQDVEVRIQAAGQRFAKTLARLEDDQAALAQDQAEQEAEQAVMEAATSQAAAAESALQERQAAWELEAQQAKQEAQQMQQQAQQITRASEATAASRQLLAELRQAEDTAEAALQEALQGVQAAQEGGRSSSQAAAQLQGQVTEAEQRAATLRRSIPTKEADKRAAASARNFKEAAKLSAEVKALTAEADAAEEAAKRAREELQMLSQQAHGSSQLEAALEAQAAAEREHALARCRRLQMAVRESAADMQAALDAEDYEEAAALQQDCDTAEADAATLRTEHGFQASDLDLGLPSQDLSQLQIGGLQLHQDPLQAEAANELDPNSVMDALDFLKRSEVESSAGSTLQPTQASTSRLATDGDDSTRLAGSDVSQASLAAGSEEGAPSSLLAPPREPPSVSDAQEQQEAGSLREQWEFMESLSGAAGNNFLQEDLSLGSNGVQTSGVQEADASFSSTQTPRSIMSGLERHPSSSTVKSVKFADLHTVRDDEGTEALGAPEYDNNVALLPLVLAQSSDPQPAASVMAVRGSPTHSSLSGLQEDP